MESSDALMVGLLSGLVGAAGATLLSTMFAFITGPLENELVYGFMERLLDRLVESGSLPSATADELMTQLEQSMASATSFGTIIAGFFFNIIIYPIFGMLGGLIGFGLTKRKAPTVPA